jgi:hypothetical protein
MGLNDRFIIDVTISVRVSGVHSLFVLDAALSPDKIALRHSTFIVRSVSARI